jgi:hypothetical protein
MFTFDTQLQETTIDDSEIHYITPLGGAYKTGRFTYAGMILYEHTSWEYKWNQTGGFGSGWGKWNMSGGGVPWWISISYIPSPPVTLGAGFERGSLKRSGSADSPLMTRTRSDRKDWYVVRAGLQTSLLHNTPLFFLISRYASDIEYTESENIFQFKTTETMSGWIAETEIRRHIGEQTEASSRLVMHVRTIEEDVANTQTDITAFQVGAGLNHTLNYIIFALEAFYEPSRQRYKSGPSRSTIQSEIVNINWRLRFGTGIEIVDWLTGQWGMEYFSFRNRQEEPLDGTLQDPLASAGQFAITAGVHIKTRMVNIDYAFVYRSATFHTMFSDLSGPPQPIEFNPVAHRVNVSYEWK